MSVCILWSKENMGGGMGCPLRGSTRGKDASPFSMILAFVMDLAFLLGSDTSPYICYLRIIDGAQWFSIFSFN